MDEFSLMGVRLGKPRWTTMSTVAKKNRRDGSSWIKGSRDRLAECDGSGLARLDLGTIPKD